MQFEFDGFRPDVQAASYLAPNCTLIGKIKLARGCSIWFNAVLRGDNDWIVLGENTNIQENCVLHTDHGISLTIGQNVTVGHQATLHGCTIGDNCLIGIGAIILNNAKIGQNSIIGAGALITENKAFPENSLIIGSPAKAVRTLSDQEIQTLQLSADNYVQKAQLFAQSLKKVE